MIRVRLQVLQGIKQVFIFGPMSRLLSRDLTLAKADILPALTRHNQSLHKVLRTFHCNWVKQ